MPHGRGGAGRNPARSTRITRPFQTLYLLSQSKDRSVDSLLGFRYAKKSLGSCLGGAPGWPVHNLPENARRSFFTVVVDEVQIPALPVGLDRTANGQKQPLLDEETVRVVMDDECHLLEANPVIGSRCPRRSAHDGIADRHYHGLDAAHCPRHFEDFGFLPFRIRRVGKRRQNEAQRKKRNEDTPEDPHAVDVITALRGFQDEQETLKLAVYLPKRATGTRPSSWFRPRSSTVRRVMPRPVPSAGNSYNGRLGDGTKMPTGPISFEIKGS